MIWQYSESGRVPGINTDSVDMNYCYTDLNINPNNSICTCSLVKKQPALWEISISGDEVKALQEELNKQCGANLKVDGLFGEDTLNACITIYLGASGN